MTRQQRDLTAALENVSQLVGDDKETRRIYGGLCHSFPILIRTNGLCQTLAFVHEKKSGGDNRARAYQRLWAHVADTIGQNEETLLNHVRSVPTTRYLHDTRRLLDAWVYYKRFAAAILGVKPGEGEE